MRSSTLILRAGILLLTLLILLMFAGQSRLHAASPTQVEDDLVLIHFSPDSTRDEQASIINSLGGEVLYWLPQLNIAQVRLPNHGEQTDTLVAAADSSAAITAIEPDTVVYGAAVTYDTISGALSNSGNITFNDPGFADAAKRYALDTINAFDAWTITTGSRDIVIAVLDSGLDPDHPDFAGRIVPGYDFVNNDDDPTDDLGHGTHVAGSIAAALNDQRGGAGICPNCTLMPVKVLNAQNRSSWFTVANGIVYAVDHGARIINLSLGAGSTSKTLERAVDYAHEHGVLLVAAAGNNNSSQPFYPAALEHVLAVSATTSRDQRCTFSNFGDYIDVAAPGQRIYSTTYDAATQSLTYTYMSGTSMAASFVSGLAGLLLSQDPHRTRKELSRLITEYVDDLGTPGKDKDYGYGRINAYLALTQSHAVRPVPAPGEFIDVSPQLRTRIFLPALSN